MGNHSTKAPDVRALVVHVVFKSDGPPSSGVDAAHLAAEKLEEAINLAQAAGAIVVAHEIITLRDDNTKTLLGSGTVARLAEVVQQHAVTLVVVNAALSGTQQRNLQKAWSYTPTDTHDTPHVACDVVDRTGLILEIFAQRAQTREGVLQVDLASLLYQRSRLVRTWTHLERQRGAMGAVGGPGEKQLELDRRLLETKIKRLRADLAKVAKTRTLQRQGRSKVPYPIVALVGYTNAGKSTLFNALTGADVMVKDQVFATLDPTLRLIRLPSGRKVILSDTVGFISDIPTHLVAAFRATLEEVIAADVILHVINAASLTCEAQMQDVTRVLTSLDVDPTVPTLDVYNKIDALPPEASRKAPLKGLFVSALKGIGLEYILESLDALFDATEHPFTMDLPLEAAKEVAWLHERGCVRESLVVDDTLLRVKGSISKKTAGQFLEVFGRSILI